MKIIIIILQAILNLVCKRRDLIANRSKIPPEYRDDVVVWYSPKKQRLTNYDVIEAYTEDFKKWNNSPEKYTGSLTSNSLALTNVSQKTALIYSPIKPYDFKVLIICCENMLPFYFYLADNMEVIINNVFLCY